LLAEVNLARSKLMKREKAIRVCPICKYVGHFEPFGYNRRTDAQCPKCRSLERHRLLKLWMDVQEWPSANERLLHIAPENALRNLLQSRCAHYVTTDLVRQGVDVRADIESLPFAERSFDAVICFHVLEHVNDRKAIGELHRILSPGGLAVLAVPIVEGWDNTYENPKITTPEDRLVHFGQEFHLRLYGRDFRERLTSIGFTLAELVGEGPDCAQYSLIPGERIFLATKLK